MKKFYLMMAAVSALALTACTSEDDFVQDAPTTQVAADQAVGFEVYLPQAAQNTRSGRVNIMNNSTLQKTGFGVFGYQTDGNYTVGTSLPNYMWNQQVNYDETSLGWFYAPLKYWPNETGHDSQTTPAGMATTDSPTNIDKLSFFAYAPWVKGTPADGTVASVYTDIEALTTVGITKLTANNGKLNDAAVANPKISYVVATDPNQSVDLLWGVAPVGGISYTAVDGNTVNKNEGEPLIDLYKPAVNTSIKFLFQHALARLGVKVVLAADQVLAGGAFDVANSKVTIEKIEIKGKFGTAGTLNLNNDEANKAKWESVTTAESSPFTINEANGLAKHLVWDGHTDAQQAVTGVTTTYSDAIQVSNVAGYSKQVTTPAYSATTPYFADADDHVGTTPIYANYNTFNKGSKVWLQKNVLSEAYTNITDVISTTYPNATVWNNIYSLSAAAKIVEITAGNKAEKADKDAYRMVGNTYYPTGTTPEIGDYIFDETLATESAPVTTGNYWLANSNYFMVIPPTTQTEADKTIKVKITYYTSTTDENVTNGVVYTKNEVEKAIVLPHFKNGIAYNLKLILGMTSVKLEAEVADWSTTTSEINLPQNTAE